MHARRLECLVLLDLALPEPKQPGAPGADPKLAPPAFGDGPDLAVLKSASQGERVHLVTAFADHRASGAKPQRPRPVLKERRHRLAIYQSGQLGLESPVFQAK